MATSNSPVPGSTRLRFTEKRSYNVKRRFESRIPEVVDRTRAVTGRIADQSLPYWTLHSFIDMFVNFTDMIASTLASSKEIISAFLEFGREFCLYLRNFPVYFENNLLTVPDPVYREF